MHAPLVEDVSTRFFTDDAIDIIVAEIAAAGGTEVFFVGRRRGEDGLIAEVEAHAYGTDDRVSALMGIPRPGEIIIHNHPTGNLQPSDADFSVAAVLGDQGIGCYIVDSACTRCRVVTKPSDPKVRVVLKEEDVLRHLSPQGAFADVIDGYEDRPQQRDMAAAVAEALNKDGIAIIEAGTGTGKSFAYLLPSLLFAIANNERVVVSTNTINLQEQLLHKDIPALRKALGGKEEFTVEIVKGRSNYVCKRKAQFAREEAQFLLEDEYVKELKDVLAWAATSTSGDRSDLPVPPRAEVWERVMSEADNCLRVRCPFYEECFFYNSRRSAARARIMIVNHSLLLADLAVRRASDNYSAAAVLPPYTRVVLDEAHHLEEVATRSLASMVTRPGIRQLLGRLLKRDTHGRDGGRGVLASVEETLTTYISKGKFAVEDARFQTLIHRLMPGVPDLREVLDLTIQDFGGRFREMQGIGDLRPGQEEKIRLTPKILEDPFWRSDCMPLLENAAAEIGVFVQAHKTLMKELDKLDDEIVEALTNPMLEWGAIIGRLDEVRLTLMKFLMDEDDLCRWVELTTRRDTREPSVRLCLSPIDVRTILRESMHDRMKSEVFTSATLAVNKRFDYFIERTGVPVPGTPKLQLDEDGMPIVDRDPPPPRSLTADLLPAPFDYRSQVFFGVPTNLPDPREPAFDGALAEMINRAVAISGGRAFILFTSYGQLRRVHAICEPTIRRLGIAVLKQGEESREVLLRKFREDETSVLFATSSFWEGVDVRGRALELLILAKLPFAVPTEPVQEAQFEAIRARGGDPFEELVVPRAVIRFKQGFGRLIRSRADRGAILVADRRVVQMGYGQKFLKSLPDVDVKKAPLGTLMGEMQGFFSPGS